MLMPGLDEGTIETLHTQIARTFAGSAGDAKLREIFNGLLTCQHYGDNFAQFALLPLCLTLLILHEHHRALSDGGAFRLQYVLGRFLAVVIALVGYGQICGLITSVFGAGGGWMSTDNVMDALTNVDASVIIAWKNLGGGFSDLPRLIPHMCVLGIMMLSCLFAYVAGVLLSLVQSAMLAIVLSLGKLCIVVTLVPGVGLAGAWARSLAQLAAWSTVAGVITRLLAYRGVAHVEVALATGHIVPLLKVSAEFIILGISTISVPVIVHKIASGAAAHGSVLGGALKAAVAWRLLRGGFGVVVPRSAPAAGAPAPAGGDGGGRRPHKVDRNSFRGGKTAAAPLAPAGAGVGSVVRFLRLPTKALKDANAQESKPGQPPPLPRSALEANTKPEGQDKLDALRARSKDAVEPMGAAQKAAPVAVPAVVSGGKATPMRVAAAPGGGTPAPKTAVRASTSAASPAGPSSPAKQTAAPASAAGAVGRAAAPASGGAGGRGPTPPLQVAGAQPPRQPRIFIQETPRGGLRASRLPPAHDTQPDGGPPALRKEAGTSGEIES